MRVRLVLLLPHLELLTGQTLMLGGPLQNTGTVVRTRSEAGSPVCVRECLTGDLHREQVLFLQLGQSILRRWASCSIPNEH